MGARAALVLTSVLLVACASHEKQPCPTSMKLSVVYNCFIWPDQDWALLIRSQLENLVRIGLADCASVDVVVSIPASHAGLTYDQLEGLLNDGRELVRSMLPARQAGQPRHTTVTQVHENSLEYPGLHLLWLLAQVSHPHSLVYTVVNRPASLTIPHALWLAQNLGHVNAQETIFLYFHTKTMVNHGRHMSRPEGEAIHFMNAIDPWQQIVAIFQSNASVTRVANFPAPLGWMWHNFWWARASYLQAVVEPIRTTRRHYYEDWLGRLFSETTEQDAEPGQWAGCDTCYSFNGNCSGNGVVYNPKDIAFCNEASA